MGVGVSKHKGIVGGLEAEAGGHREDGERHEEEHRTARRQFEASRDALMEKIATRKREWEAQDKSWRELVLMNEEQERDVKAKEALLIKKIVEMFSGKMFSLCFGEWKSLTQTLKRQRFREGFRTQVEELKLDNAELTVTLREVQQKLVFLEDDGLKAKATALISRLGHRDRAMWFAMWRSFVRESVYNRRDKVQIEWKQQLEQMTEQRDYMLWRLDNARKNQDADSSAIEQLDQHDVDRTASLPRLGEGLLLALNRVDQTANKFPNYARRTEIVRQQASLRRACLSFSQAAELEPEPEPEPRPELEPEPKVDEERAAEAVGVLNHGGLRDDGTSGEPETVGSSVYERAMAITQDLTQGSPDASLKFPKLQVPAALPCTALRRHGYMLPRRVPRQIEPLFSQTGKGSSALLYGTQGGGAAASYTDFNMALGAAIRQHARADAGAEVELEETHGESPSGAAASSGAKWVKPQPPPQRHRSLEPRDSSAQQHRHRQLKPAIG